MIGSQFSYGNIKVSDIKYTIKLFLFLIESQNKIFLDLQYGKLSFSIHSRTLACLLAKIGSSLQK